MSKTYYKADVIILGCSVPGIVAAHRLKKRFGSNMEIVVLDLLGLGLSQQKPLSRGSVSFATDVLFDGGTLPKTRDIQEQAELNELLSLYAKELKVELPETLLQSRAERGLLKVFQNKRGDPCPCLDNFNDFDYVNIFSRFELKQFQNSLDASMMELFSLSSVTGDETRVKLLYYDQNSMEQYIRNCLLLEASREIMRHIVKLICNCSADKVSVLFYLHQCYRSHGVRNQVDGTNTRLREKALFYCANTIVTRLQQSVADLIVGCANITKIILHEKQKVMVETPCLDINFICDFLAFALRPEQLDAIELDAKIIDEYESLECFVKMAHSRSKRFFIQYEESFWRCKGYSGDILSVSGPILWAMEKPMASGTSSEERYSTLVGFLASTGSEDDNRDAVARQLAKLFGAEALTPVGYKEHYIDDIYVPLQGDYVGILEMSGGTRFQRDVPLSGRVGWTALDVFAEGHLSAAIEAGHNAYLNIVHSLRPQASTYEDTVASSNRPDSSVVQNITRLSCVNYLSASRLACKLALAALLLFYTKNYALQLYRNGLLPPVYAFSGFVRKKVFG